MSIQHCIYRIIFLVVVVWAMPLLHMSYSAVNIQTSGKFVTSSSLGISTQGGVDLIVFTDGVPPEFTYDVTELPQVSKVEWGTYTKSLSADYVSLSTTFSLSSSLVVLDKPYVVTARDASDNVVERKVIYVFNMADKLLRPLTIDTLAGSDWCNTIDLVATASIPALDYVTTSGSLVSVPRKLYIDYSNYVVSADKELSLETQTDSVATSKSGVSVLIETSISSPYVATAFTLRGDNIAEALGISQSVTSASVYPSHIVIAALTAQITERDGKNEVDRVLSSDSASPNSFGGSAPLQVAFSSNSNTPVAQFYDWIIIDNETPTDSSNIYHDPNLNYTFNRSGLYTVILRVRHNYDSSTSTICPYACGFHQDSLVVTVSESMLQIPSAFSPNGDGINDEFRVAFKSLSEFHCSIYNRWGHKVYEWSDPSTGWDGKVNGKLATTGPYYYVIEAEGTDFNSSGNRKTYSKKGCVNLFR